MMAISAEGSHHPDIQSFQTNTRYNNTQHGIRSLADSLCELPSLTRWSRWSAPITVTAHRRPESRPEGRPEPLIPDVNRELMFEIDGLTLAALRPFNRHTKAAPVPLPPPPPSSPAVQPAWRLHRSPSMPHDHRMTPYPTDLNSHPAFGYMPRRQSAPSLRQVTSRPRLATLPTETLVAPIRLGRPLEPLRSAAGIEIWWPAVSAGNVKVHVFISSWLFANPEKLTRTFDLPQLHAPTAKEAEERACVVSCPTPGTILPIPGDTPSHDVAPRRRFSMASPHTPTISTFVSGRKTYQNEFPPEPIGEHPSLLTQLLEPC